MKRSALLFVMPAVLLTLAGAASTARAQTYQSVAQVLFTWYSPGQGGFVSNGFSVVLYDHLAPNAVNNFLDYADSGEYTYNVVDRLRLSSFGGAEFFSSGDYWVSSSGGGLVAHPVQASAPIASELLADPTLPLSNTRGTLASYDVMGQTAATTTSRWLLNLSDNNANDFDALGYTPFGEVMTPGMLLPYAGNPMPQGTQWGAYSTLNGGMALADAIAGLPVFEFSDAFAPQVGGGNFLPVVNYTQTDYNTGKKLTAQNLLFTSVQTVGKTPQLGDLDFKGTVNVTDALLFDVEFDANVADRLWQADLNGDGLIDNVDRWLLVDKIGTVVWGDVNLSGDVTADDFNPFMLLYNGTNDYLFSGDLNRDGVIDDADYLLFFTNFGSEAPPPHDVNNDGVITLQDLLAYNTLATFTDVDYHFQLDVNRDGVLDAAEREQFTSLFAAWVSPHDDPPFVTPGEGGGAVIPEPASAGLLAAGLALLLRRPRKSNPHAGPRADTRAAGRLPRRAGWLTAAMFTLLLAPAAFAGVGRNIVHVDYVWYSPAHQGYVSAGMDLLLYNDIAPNTVENFKQYITEGLYDWSIVHRNAAFQDGSPFVIQGGGFTVENDDEGYAMAVPITTFGTIDSEWNGDLMSNTRGTLAMARVGTDENSSSSQWFINMSDENTFLDFADNPGVIGFTVFGKVIEANTFGSTPPNGGMDLADAIANLPTFDMSAVGSALGEVPLVNYNQEMYNQGTWPTFGNFLWVLMTLDEDVLVGDVSGDGQVNTEDINPFIAALTSPDYAIRADINQDGFVNTEDINPFISLLIASPPSGGGAIIPEPASIATLLLAATALLRRRR